MRAHLFAVLCAASWSRPATPAPGAYSVCPRRPTPNRGAAVVVAEPDAAAASALPDEYTTLVLGERSWVVPSNPPLCRDGLGVCQYFNGRRPTAPSSCNCRDARQQPNQTVDLSVISLDGESWGDYFQNGIEVRTFAMRGAVHHVTVCARPAEFSLFADPSRMTGPCSRARPLDKAATARSR